MQADNVSRGLLAAILVCFVLLVIEDRNPDESVSEPAPAPAIERFVVRPIAMRRGPPLLLRTDTATGEGWTMGLMARGVWEPLAEGAAGVPEPDGDVPGRFSIRAHKQTRGLPTLVRLDTVTGRTWRKGSKTPRPWVAVRNPGSKPGGTAGSAPMPNAIEEGPDDPSDVADDEEPGEDAAGENDDPDPDEDPDA